MSHVPHELAEEIPADTDKIYTLNRNDSHFPKLTEQYHMVNRDNRRIETNATPADQGHEKRPRRQPLALKDQLAVYLAKP